ncbi:Uncharacterized [Syntrophomonas zehnderi OL-4]|uniref:Uncharacterized n=1 Tax=Syntrophomonas zehnderi OL-4 TaxID=690567 RepID=A0A0E3W3F9_9FIRM|nr:hypothetical protein [Syntrophomonas zehnderi]CFX79859.1 Uncharacterized [Syntrophomonas zehnderi OL-4]
MSKEITLVFNNEGLRSYIEVDLCAECPRQDDKGCCGFYSPVFYSADLAYLIINKPDLIDRIFSLERLTILDHSVTVNNIPEGRSYYCRFHSRTEGCLLDQPLRESICRHFVCSGIAWEDEEELVDWKNFIKALTDYEINLNQRLSEAMEAQGLTLRDSRRRNLYLERLVQLYRQETEHLPDFISKMPRQETYKLKRTLRFGTDWEL